jgi:hypothetical protein
MIGVQNYRRSEETKLWIKTFKTRVAKNNGRVLSLLQFLAAIEASTNRNRPSSTGTGREDPDRKPQ